MHLRILILFVVLNLMPLVNGCGELLPKDSSNSNYSFMDTLNFISQNGLPKLNELMPALPNQLALVKGVNVSSSGLPERPGETNLNVAEIKTTAQVETLLNDASAISSQGFSELRRIESVLANFLTPVYEVMNQNDLFSKLENPVGDSNRPDLADIFSETGLRESRSVDYGSIFSQLVSSLSYTVALGESDVLPEFLKLSAIPNDEKIYISGLFNVGGDDLATGFALGLRIASMNDFDIDFTFAPNHLSGMIGSWKSEQCADDLFKIRLSSQSESRSASISSLECAENAGASSQLSILQSNDALSISGGFVQNYPGVRSDSLRGFLGEKQGFILQAAASPDLSKMSAAAAVLGESDFTAANPDSVSQFGVGELLGKFINAKFWTPKLKAQKNYNGLSLSHYENPAFLLCNTFVSTTLSLSLQDGIEEINKLCAGEDVPGESYLAGFSTLSRNISSSTNSLASTLQTITFGAISSSKVKQATASTVLFLDKVVSVLKFRNNIHISSDAEIFFKEVPNSDYEPLVSTLKSISIVTLNDLNWQDQARLELPTLNRKNLPKIEFGSSLDGLRDYFTSTCNRFAEEVNAETGKDVKRGESC